MTAQILVVDDEPDLEALVLQKFRHQIRDGTINFVFAHDGVEALAALKANGSIDLVVTDINMPRMDGLSLLLKLQENEERISTIIVSAYGDMADVRTAMNRGAFDFVTKPIDFLILKRQSPRPSATSDFCGRPLSDRRRRSGPMPRCRDTFRRTLFSVSPPIRVQSISADSAARLRRYSQTSKVSLRLSRHWSRPYSDPFSMTISQV